MPSLEQDNQDLIFNRIITNLLRFFVSNLIRSLKYH